MGQAHTLTITNLTTKSNIFGQSFVILCIRYFCINRYAFQCRVHCYCVHRHRVHCHRVDCFCDN